MKWDEDTTIELLKLAASSVRLRLGLRGPCALYVASGTYGDVRSWGCRRLGQEVMEMLIYIAQYCRFLWAGAEGLRHCTALS